MALKYTGALPLFATERLYATTPTEPKGRFFALKTNPGALETAGSSFQWYLIINFHCGNKLWQWKWLLPDLPAGLGLLDGHGEANIVRTRVNVEEVA